MQAKTKKRDSACPRPTDEGFLYLFWHEVIVCAIFREVLLCCNVPFLWIILQKVIYG